MFQRGRELGHLDLADTTTRIEPVVVGGSGRFFGAQGACRVGFDGTRFDDRCRIVQ